MQQNEAVQQNRAVLRNESMDLNETLERGSFELADVTRYLDALDMQARVAAIRSLGKRAQAHLFDAAKGQRTLTLLDIVPARIPDRTEVPHLGKNSLAMFTHFAKVFFRPEADAKELWGYNRSGAIVGTFVGPGYYVSYERDGEVMVDYTRLPTDKLEAWPKILSNEARLSRFVYSGMIDVLRGVSEHVTIGRAIRNGKEADNWFVLCRSV